MARRRAGLTQRELAGRTGIPQPSISRIERGRVSPSVDTLDRLLSATDLELEAVPRLGDGVDRSLIRELLALTPRERLSRADESAASMDRLIAARDRNG